jgi:hypothetical protein
MLILGLSVGISCHSISGATVQQIQYDEECEGWAEGTAADQADKEFVNGIKDCLDAASTAQEANECIDD